MVHCPECEETIESPDDVEFLDMDVSVGFIRASKRFYLTACASCGAAIGSGVAGAR